MAFNIKRDHEGVPTCKVVFWGPTMAGKTTALTIFKVLKSLEDPENVYKFLKLEDPTGRTLFFDQAIFGVGKDPRTGLPYLKYHIFTVPGQDRHVGQRKVVTHRLHQIVQGIALRNRHQAFACLLVGSVQGYCKLELFTLRSQPADTLRDARSRNRYLARSYLCAEV